jgi:endonuclease-8
MPEGPEIRRAADVVADALVGDVVTTVRFGLPALRREATRLKNHRVIDVETRGKAMLTHFDHGWSIYSHNQLYGVWHVCAGRELPSTNRSLRLLLQTRDYSAILYSASDISVWRTEDLQEHPFLARLGPDIMDGTLGWRDIAARLQSRRFSGRALASLYLDQGFLAGIGNYLRTEILFDAGLHPLRRAADLGVAERGRLARSSLRISRRSYQTGGITLSPALVRALQKAGSPYQMRRFAAFGRGGQPCYRCGTPVAREEIGSRRIYWCKTCQA